MEHYPERGIEERYYEGENEWNRRRGRGQGNFGREYQQGGSWGSEYNRGPGNFGHEYDEGNWPIGYGSGRGQGHYSPQEGQGQYRQQSGFQRGDCTNLLPLLSKVILYSNRSALRRFIP